MNDKCENLEKCPFFLSFAGNSEVVKNGWISLFCNDIEKSKRCKRKQYRITNNAMPPVSMTPTGVILEP
ncbi:MAG: hypothetical protein CR988_06340 [Treponema sp.]|nr:MAG: hypothetical protein CR988_06340 [Treponema sp.]